MEISISSKNYSGGPIVVSRRSFIKRTMIAFLGIILTPLPLKKSADAFVWGLVIRVLARTAARLLGRAAARAAARSAARSAARGAARSAVRGGARAGAAVVGKSGARKFSSKLLRANATLVALLTPEMVALAEEYGAAALWEQKGSDNELEVLFKNKSANNYTFDRLFLKIRDLERNAIEEEKEIGYLTVEPNSKGKITFLVTDLPNKGIKEISIFSKGIRSSKSEPILVQ